MIGLVKLTAPNGEACYVNPQFIGFFAESSRMMAIGFGLNWEQCYQKGSFVVVAGQRIQVKEVPNEIVNALTRLRQRQENNMLDLMKKREREDWQGNDDDDDT